VDGDAVSASLIIRYHGTPRTMFGSTARDFTLEMVGRREGEQIGGQTHRSGRPEPKLSFRLTRRAGPS